MMAAGGMGIGRPVGAGLAPAGADRARLTYSANLLMVQQQLPATATTLYQVNAGQQIIMRSIHVRNVDTASPHTYWLRLVPLGGLNDVTNEFHSVVLNPLQEDLYLNEEVLLSGYQIVGYADSPGFLNIRICGISSASQ
jgi:hypothetical protein